MSQTFELAGAYPERSRDKLIAKWTKTENSQNFADSAWDSFAFVFAGYGRYIRVALFQVALNSNFRSARIGQATRYRQITCRRSIQLTL